MNKFITSSACAAIALIASNAQAQLLGGGGGIGIGGLGGGVMGSISSTSGSIGGTVDGAASASRRVPRADRSVKTPTPAVVATGDAAALNRRATTGVIGSVNPTRQANAAGSLSVVRPGTVVIPAPPAVAVGRVAIPSVNLGYLGGGNVVVVGRRQALIDDGIVFIPSGRVPAYLDRQVVILERELAGTGVEVQRRGKQIFIEMPSDVTFAFDKSAIQSRFYPVLYAVSRTLNQFPATYVDVVGHTDAIGTDAYNQALSERRASSVANFLVDNRAQPDRLYVEGLGESDPVATNASVWGRAANRRVEIILTPHEGPA